MRVSVAKDLAPLRLAAFAHIDARAAAARAIYQTPGKDSVYLGKVQEAAAYIAAGQPDDLSNYPYLAAETGLSASNASDLAELWLNLSHRGTELDAAIERVTMAAKRAVSLADDPGAIDAVIDDLDFD